MGRRHRPRAGHRMAVRLGLRPVPRHAKESAMRSVAFRHTHPTGAVCYDFWCAFGVPNRQPGDTHRDIDQLAIADAILHPERHGEPYRRPIVVTVTDGDSVWGRVDLSRGDRLAGEPRVPLRHQLVDALSDLPGRPVRALLRLLCRLPPRP